MRSNITRFTFIAVTSVAAFFIFKGDSMKISKTTSIIKDKTCCFIGDSVLNSGKTQRQVSGAVMLAFFEAIDMGYTTFIADLATEFGLISAGIVLGFRKTGYDVKLVCISPEREEDAEKHRKLLEYVVQACQVEYFSEEYSQDVFFKNAVSAIDRSSFVVFSGFEQNKKPLDYASRSGVKIIDVFAAFDRQV